MLIETDILLAALNLRDPLCTVARRVLALEHLMLSPYSLLEWNLLVRAGKIKVKNFDGFSKRLESFFKNMGLEVIRDKPSFHSLARKIEYDHHLTFFDSLHAAVAKIEDYELVSFDRSYGKLRKLGVKYIDPRTSFKP